MKPSTKELKAFLTGKLGDEVASLLTPARLKYLLDNELYSEQLLKDVRPEDFEIPPFSKGVRNQLVQAFKTAPEGVLLASLMHLGLLVPGQIRTSTVELHQRPHSLPPCFCSPYF